MNTAVYDCAVDIWSIGVMACEFCKFECAEAIFLSRVLSTIYSRNSAFPHEPQNQIESNPTQSISQC